MNYICVHPENFKELEELLEEFKYMLGEVANKPEERKKIKCLSPDKPLGTPFTFICSIDIEVGISVENATHPLSEAHFPTKETQKTGVYGMICMHCHDSGY